MNINRALSYHKIEGTETLHPMVIKTLKNIGPFGVSGTSPITKDSALTNGTQESTPGVSSHNPQTLQSEEGGSLSVMPIIYGDGSLYEGETVNRRRNGLGRLIMTTGDYLEANWQNNRPVDKCYLVKSSGIVYNGELNEEYRASGCGELKYPNGQVLKGTFLNGLLHGRGQARLPSGDFYLGNFEQGEMTGQGSFQYADGTIYRGRVLKGIPHGQGEQIFKDKSCYYGEFDHGRREGFGEMKWTDGKKYVGLWKGGQMNGKGTATHGNEVIEGEWNHGAYVGEANSVLNSSHSAASFIAKLSIKQSMEDLSYYH